MDILVVDDDALSLRLLTALVEKLGHRVIAASDGLSAWEIYRQRECRVVISDWNMPGIDGIEFLTRIRTIGGTSYTYFIMLTSRSDREDVAAGMTAGADDLLIKPISRDDLEARLNVAKRIVSLHMELASRNAELMSVNQRMRQDLQAAVKVQEALLPVSLPQIPKHQFAWLYRPCDQLGGDTLNLFRLDEHHLGFYVLDVSGHGVSSALLAVQVSRFLSPLIANGILYAPREDGGVFVASVADDKFKLLAENDMEEPVIGSPVPASDRLFIRGEKHLFCLTTSP